MFLVRHPYIEGIELFNYPPVIIDNTSHCSYTLQNSKWIRKDIVYFHDPEGEEWETLEDAKKAALSSALDFQTNVIPELSNILQQLKSVNLVAAENKLRDTHPEIYI
jgi:hypothetical protein